MIIARATGNLAMAIQARAGAAIMFYDTTDPVDWPNGLFLSQIEISDEHAQAQATECEPRLERNIRQQ